MAQLLVHFMECWNFNPVVSLPSAGLSSSFCSVNLHLNSYVRPSPPSLLLFLSHHFKAFSRPYVYTYSAFISCQFSFYSVSPYKVSTVTETTDLIIIT